MKNICILGATGSIGLQAIEVIEATPSLNLSSFSYHSNEALAKKIKKRHPEARAIFTGKSDDVSKMLAELAVSPETDTVLHAVSGTDGIEAAVAALRAEKTLALANKESLVSAGELIMKESRGKNGRLLPVDSEHSAIYQCLGGSLEGKDIETIVLTASGGPFLDWDRQQIADSTARQALRHPKWNMGKKISIDSATMMNKGLEIIEASHLFGMPADKIEVIVHRESVIHGMVRFMDGSLLAELSKPDMKQPISFALTGEKRARLQRLDFVELGKLSFEAPDPSRFPCLTLARDVAAEGGIMPAVLNAANEVAVQAFLDSRIGFYDISSTIAEVLDSTRNVKLESLEQLKDVINNAKQLASRIVETKSK